MLWPQERGSLNDRLFLDTFRNASLLLAASCNSRARFSSRRQLRRGSTSLRANGWGLGTPGCRYRSPANNPDKEEQNNQVNDAQDNQERQGVVTQEAQGIHDQVDRACNQDIEQSSRDQDQPGKLHELIGAQARKRGAHPDKDRAE